MYSLKQTTFLMGVALIATLYSNSLFAAELPDNQMQNEINFITGGIGEEETGAMEAVKGDYNLRITSADKAGHFSGEPHIIITDMQHHELLSADAGPLFYAEIPAGHYLVEGSNKGENKSQSIVVNGKKIVAVRFIWQAHPDDSTTY